MRGQSNLGKYCVLRGSAVLVSESAIGTDQALKFVLTLSSSNTVEYRQVTLGPSIEGMRVVRSGLKEGDQIVVRVGKHSAQQNAARPCVESVIERFNVTAVQEFLLIPQLQFDRHFPMLATL